MPAAAQVTGSIGIESDLRHRGYSVSREKPVLIADIGYDHASGIYANGEAILVADGDDPALLGGRFSIGYARRISSKVSIDAGVMRSEYSARSSLRRAYHYTEAYVGVAAGDISARVYYSPDYYRSGTSTLYAEAQAALHPLPKWSITAHAGAMTYLSDPPRYVPRTLYDWRLSVSRQIGQLDLHAAVSGGGPRNAYYPRYTPSRAVFTAGASFAF